MGAFKDLISDSVVEGLGEAELQHLKHQCMLAEISTLKDALDDLLDGQRYYQRSITRDQLEHLRDEMKRVIRDYD